MQPLNGIVFAIDGILIGASDGRYLALSMAAAFAGVRSDAGRRRLGRLGRARRLGRALPPDRHALDADGRTLPAAALARDGVRLDRLRREPRQPRSDAEPPRSSTANARATGAIAEPANETTRPKKRSRKFRCRSGASGARQPIHPACASSARARGSTGSTGQPGRSPRPRRGRRRSSRPGRLRRTSPRPSRGRRGRPSAAASSRSRARWPGTSSKTPKWVSASRAGSRRSVSTIVASQASRSMSGGGVGGRTKLAGRDADSHRVARVERAVVVQHRDVVARMTGAREALRVRARRLRRRGCSRPEPARAHPRARRTCRRRAAGRSPRAGSARRDAERRPRRRAPAATGFARTSAPVAPAWSKWMCERSRCDTSPSSSPRPASPASRFGMHGVGPQSNSAMPSSVSTT